jgi:hypothetical protein
MSFDLIDGGSAIADSWQIGMIHDFESFKLEVD